MTTEMAIDLARQMLWTAMVISMPVLVIGMIVGLVISVFQAVTQVQEQTLSFVPKIIVMTIVLGLSLPWVAAKLMEFSREMFMLGY
jgi:flagellar biosynthetic protein FliQ